jgi:hypothetical protein
MHTHAVWNLVMSALALAALVAAAAIFDAALATIVVRLAMGLMP